MLKAITLYDPWASLMAIGAKVNETRPRRTNHLGDIAIHVAKREDTCSPETAIAALNACIARKFLYEPEDVAGCIVAVVDLYEVRASEWFVVEDSETARLRLPGRIIISREEYQFGNYSPGRFIYRTRNLRRLDDPVPCRGYQAVGWTVPPDVEAAVRKQLPPRCSWGLCTDSPCQKPPTHVSLLHGARTQMLWCDEHAANLRDNQQVSPGHGIEKICPLDTDGDGNCARHPKGCPI